LKIKLKKLGCGALMLAVVVAVLWPLPLRWLAAGADLAFRPPRAPASILEDARATTIVYLESDPTKEYVTLRRVDLAGRPLANDVKLRFAGRMLHYAVIASASGKVAVVSRGFGERPNRRATQVSLIDKNGAGQPTLLRWPDSPSDSMTAVEVEGWIDGRYLAICRDNGTYRYDPPDGSLSPIAHGSLGDRCDTQNAAVGWASRSMNDKDVRQLEKHAARVGMKAWGWQDSPNQLTMALYDIDGRVLVLNRKTDEARVIRPGTSFIEEISYDRTGNHLIMECSYGSIDPDSRGWQLLGCDVRTGRTWRVAVKRGGSLAWAVVPKTDQFFLRKRAGGLQEKAGDAGSSVE